MNVRSNISVGGTLHYVICLNDSKVYVQDRHNMVVDQGMRLLLSIPESNLSWHKSVDNLNSSVYGNIFSGTLGSGLNSGLIPHFGIASYMACGTSDISTTPDMTQLAAFEGDATSPDSYGAVTLNDSTFGVTSFLTDASSTSVTYQYLYKAKSTFTCKEFGTYCLVPNSTFQNGETVFSADKVDITMFSRTVLTEPVEMTAGETYIFSYTLRFNRSTMSDTLDTMFGLPAVQSTYSTTTTTLSQFNAYLPGLNTSSNKFVLTNRNYSFNHDPNDVTAYLGYGLVNYNTDFSNTSSKMSKAGIANSAPLWIWSSSATTPTVSYSNNSTPNYGNSTTNFGQTDDVYGSRAYDEVGDFYGIKTYHIGKPYSDTTNMYLSVTWGNMVWKVNHDGTTWSPYGRSNEGDYLITCKTVLTREES